MVPAWGTSAARFLAPLDAVDDLGCALACLGGGDLAVGAEGDTAWPAARPALDDVDLAARGVDAHAEAGQLAVPDDDVALGDRERIHRPARERQRATARHPRHISTHTHPVNGKHAVITKGCGGFTA